LSGGSVQRTTRIGAVSFLNTRPLIRGLEQDAREGRIELVLDVPSGLAPRLAAGELDLALLPVIELASFPGAEIVPGLAITTRGASRSVLLLARRPLQEIETVALDPESRTSNGLVQVLFAERFGAKPDFVPGPRELERALAAHDAAVRIGDKALFEPIPPGTTVHDLGFEWTAASGLPFVWAVWVARPGVVDRRLYRLLHESRRAGAAAIEHIAQSFCWNGRQDPALARTYLMEHIHYRLGAGEVEALRRFFAAAARLGLVDRPAEIRFALAGRTDCHDAAERHAEGRA
jgi:chorismate dehydratase